MASFSYDPNAYQPLYWNSKGKYQTDLDRLYKKLVPFAGKAKTKQGNILRLASNFYYDHFNNGGGNIEMGLFGDERNELAELLMGVPHQDYELILDLTKPKGEDNEYTDFDVKRYDTAIDKVMEYVIELEAK